MKTLLPHLVGSNISISTLCEYTNVDTPSNSERPYVESARFFEHTSKMQAAESRLFQLLFLLQLCCSIFPPPPKKKKPMETPAPWAVHENEFKYWDRALKI